MLGEMHTRAHSLGRTYMPTRLQVLRPVAAMLEALLQGEQVEQQQQHQQQQLLLQGVAAPPPVGGGPQALLAPGTAAASTEKQGQQQQQQPHPPQQLHQQQQHHQHQVGVTGMAAVGAEVEHAMQEDRSGAAGGGATADDREMDEFDLDFDALEEEGDEEGEE